MGNILLPKHYHPDFKVKNVKPVRYKIDERNKFAKSLYAGYMLGDYLVDGPNALRDLCGKIHLYGDVNDLEQVTTNVGKAVKQKNAGYYYSTSNKDKELFDGTKPFTLVFHAKANSKISDRAVFGLEGPDDLVVYLSDKTTGNFRVFWRNGGGQILSYDKPDSYDYAVYVYQFDGNQSHRIFLEGNLVDDTTSSVSSSGFNSGMSILRWRGGQNYGIDDELASVFIFNSFLSEAEISALSNDLYQVFKPANEQYYFAPDSGGAGDNYSGTATSNNTSTTTALGQKTSTGTVTSAADDTTTTTSFKTGLGNVTSINTASTVKTGLAIMLGTAISLNVAATTTAGTKSETATGTATSSNTATATTTGDKTGLGTAASNNTSTTTADGVQSGTGAGSATSTNTASTATAGSKSGLGLVSSVNGYLITLQSNAIMLGTATSSNTSESTVIGLSENDASGTLTSISTSQTITAGTKIGLGDVDSANTSATTTTATTDREGTLTSANTSSAIVSGANTAAPVIIRSVDLVCELPYILLTRAIDGSLFMAYPPEVSNITTAYQNNDTNINVVITDNGETVSMGSITEAEYVIASRDKSQTYVSKSLGSGISKGSDQLVLSLSQADTSALLDIYYHELQITSDGKHATVFAEHINFIDTVI